MSVMKSILVTFAVREESFDIQLAYSHRILYTGIGKTKSAYLLTQNILENKPDLVLNIGTVGTFDHNIGDVFIVKEFVDRDYESVKLPGIEYKINGFSLLSDLPLLLSEVQKYPNLGTCSTGDTFVTDSQTSKVDIVDMEAYAQAYVCQQMKIPFFSVKYITDRIGSNSIKEWEDKLSDARIDLKTWLDDFSLCL